MKPTHDPERSLGFLLHDVSRLLRRNFTRRVTHVGLTQAQWQTLAHLSRQEGVNQATLAETLEIQPITLARLIDRLEERGWVARRPDPKDRRAFCLYLTPAVQPLLAEMWRRAAETRAEATAELTDTARDQMVESLLAIKRRLIELERQQSSSPRQRSVAGRGT